MTRGTCGKNLTWALDDDTLTISGTGEMENYIFVKKKPQWEKQGSSIKKVVIEEGVTSIGYSAFWGCSSLTKIYYPAGADFSDKLREGNKAELIPYDEFPPELKADESVAEPDKPDDTEENVKQPAQVKPPPAETNCTVYSNTRISRA